MINILSLKDKVQYFFLKTNIIVSNFVVYPYFRKAEYGITVS